MGSHAWLKELRQVVEIRSRHVYAAIFFAFVLVQAVCAAQNAPPPGQPIAPQQLDDLVAPIALYPDPLLGQVLAASTYPMEIAEADQWLRDHPHWRPSKLMDQAKKQPWDPSIQGLVAFPDVLARLAGNINWTSQLGNAFLAQQADVMQAAQRMRTVRYEGKPFEDLKVAQQHSDKLVGSITIRERNMNTFGDDVKQMLERRLTFDSAIKSEDFSLVSKQRLAIVRRDLFEQLDRLSLA